jgi:hypothetical protein
MKKPRNYNQDNKPEEIQEQEVLSLELEEELSNGIEEGEE